MGQEIQKQNAAPLTFQKQPKEFLAQVGIHLDTLQKVYRTQLPEAEMIIWRETLKDYSYQEFERAMTHLVTNPPRYELEDGSIQVWRGMPKLPDVVNVMLDLREAAVMQAQKTEAEERRKEFAKLEVRRKEHPEEFMGWGEFRERLRKENPTLAAKIGMGLGLASQRSTTVTKKRKGKIGRSDHDHREHKRDGG